ncbi:MAG: hypothetical protein LAN63_11240 [Acidobacteriia bacterium]|nr:hypothetical protein [Terriglobia bacterium]
MRKCLAIFLLLCGAPLIGLAQGGKVETLGPATDSSIQEAVRQVLEPKGSRVVLDDGTTACEIWLRKSVPGAAKKNSSDALYGQLAESTLVGVISFPQATTDYRGEAVKAGAYTLRYELMPNDGNHLGVAPNRDFLLLVPAASDADPGATFKFEELVNLSRKATGTRHPGPLSLVQAGGGGAPAVSKDEEEHWVFSASLKLASGEDLPFSLVVKGTAPQ